MDGSLSAGVPSSFWVQIAQIQETDPVIRLKRGICEFQAIYTRYHSCSERQSGLERSVRRLESRIGCRGYDIDQLSLQLHMAFEWIFGPGGAVEKVSQAPSGQTIQELEGLYSIAF